MWVFGSLAKLTSARQRWTELLFIVAHGILKTTRTSGTSTSDLGKESGLQPASCYRFFVGKISKSIGADSAFSFALLGCSASLRAEEAWLAAKATEV